MTAETKRKTDTLEYTVAGHFLPALIYDDRSGLSDQDEMDLDSFIETTDAAAEECQAKTWYWSYNSTEDDGPEYSFADCEICGLKADCTEIQLVMLF